MDFSSITSITLPEGEAVALAINGNTVWQAEVGCNALCFTAEEAGSTISLTQTGAPAAVELEYSNDGKSWIDFVIGDTYTISPVESKMYLRNKSTTTTAFSTSGSDYYQFSMAGVISASGDITSLIKKTAGVANFSSDLLSINQNYCYYSLFKDCTSLTTAPELPTATLSVGCYWGMFNGCTHLTTAPELPAKSLKESCYTSMFAYCSGLTASPKLPATALADYCYNTMFFGCTSLTTAPELPATALAPYCYKGMFQNCSGLTASPKLPATTLADYCYQSMFYTCTNLTALPALPATTLAKNCYYTMFYGCTKIKLAKASDSTYKNAYRIPTSGTGATAANAMAIMFYNTGGTFKSTPTINTTYYTSNTIIS